MFVVLNFIWNLIRAKLAKRLLFIDEAWIMMKNDDSATFLFGLVKRARKYYLGVTTITPGRRGLFAHRPTAARSSRTRPSNCS